MEPPEILKAGYQSGECHLCALLWLRAGGSYLDPDKTTAAVDFNAPLEVRLSARDFQQEHKIMMARETDMAKKLWYKIASMPPM